MTTQNDLGLGRNLLNIIAVVAAAAILSSCATPSTGNASNFIENVSPAWRKADSQSLVFYPKDLADSPETDFRNGEWVHAGPGKFFIPKSGTPSKTRDALAADALGLRQKFGSPRPASKKGQTPSQPIYGRFVDIMSGAGAVATPALLLMGEMQAHANRHNGHNYSR